MILRKRDINLFALRNQILAQNIDTSSLEFVMGYINFAKCFFHDLDCCSDAFPVDNGHEPPLDIIADGTLQELDILTRLIPSDRRENFWLGVLSASKRSYHILQLAYELENINKELA